MMLMLFKLLSLLDDQLEVSFSINWDAFGKTGNDAHNALDDLRHLKQDNSKNGRK